MYMYMFLYVYLYNIQINVCIVDLVYYTYIRHRKLKSIFLLGQKIEIDFFVCYTKNDLYKMNFEIIFLKMILEKQFCF